MSLRAYQQAAQRSETPRDAEYRLFAQVTRALMDLKSLPRENLGGWIDVLHWNRRMWAALADDCSSPTNTLPDGVRAQIISLSLFVHRHSSHVMRKEGDLDTLIDINRMMMQGLSGRSEAA
jgi:flagellar protein FlaF